MRRVVLGQLLHRRSRTLALLAGILVATTSSTVLKAQAAIDAIAATARA